MDPSIRDLERLAARGDPTAGKALLAVRLRAGTLSLAGLELAAYLGDETARAVLGPSALSRGPRFGGWAAGELTEDALAWSDLTMWILGLERWGVPTMVRALVALSRVAADELRTSDPSLTSVHRALDATLAWCDAPSEDTADALEVAQEEAATDWLALDPLYFDAQGRPTRVSLLNQEALEAAEVASMAAGRDGHRFTQGARDPRAKVFLPLTTFDESSGRFRGRLSPDECEALVRDTLLPIARDDRTLQASLACGPARAPLADGVERPELSWMTRSERLELAAHLGHAPSRRLLGPSVFGRWPGQAGWGRAGRLNEEELICSDLTAWVEGLELWGVPWLVRGLRALADEAATRYGQLGPGEEELRRVVACTRSWCDSTEPEAVDRVERLRDAYLKSALAAEEHEVRAAVRARRGSLLRAALGPANVVIRATTGRSQSAQPSLRLPDPRTARSMRSVIYSLRGQDVDVVSVIRDALLPVVITPEPA